MCFTQLENSKKITYKTENNKIGLSLDSPIIEVKENKYINEEH